MAHRKKRKAKAVNKGISSFRRRITMEEQHKNCDYADAQEKRMRYLEVIIPPVAVSLIRHKGQLPEGVKELEKPMFYCAMVKYAMLGKVFSAREYLDETVLVGVPAEMLLRVLKNLPRIGYVKARLSRTEGR